MSLSTEQMRLFAQELSALVRAGIPLPTGLRRLGSTTGDRTLATLAVSAATQAEQGIPLSQALSRLRPSLPPPLIALIHCGERTGDLRGVFDFLQDHLQKRRRFETAIETACIYPGLVLVLCVIITELLAIFVAPHLAETFRQLGAELPPLTRMILNFCRFAASPAGLAIAAFMIIAMLWALFSSVVRRGLAEFFLIIPMPTPLIVVADFALAFRFVAVMLQHGTPLPTALRAAALTAYQSSSSKALEAMALGAEKGFPVGTSLPSSLPTTAIWLVQQGEARGDLAGGMDAGGEYCQERYRQYMDEVGRYMEPILIMVAAVFIGVTIIAFYLPLFAIPKLVGK